MRYPLIFGKSHVALRVFDVGCWVSGFGRPGQVTRTPQRIGRILRSQKKPTEKRAHRGLLQLEWCSGKSQLAIIAVSELPGTAAIRTVVQ